MAIKETTTISMKLMIPLIGLSFWTGTTYMMVIKIQERQAAMEDKINHDVDQQLIRDRAINDKLSDVKNETSAMNGHLEVILGILDKSKRRY